LAPVDLDRQSIERRDFPIGRRGYDTAAVDAHLRTLASAIEDLQRVASGPGPDSLAANAGAQVQSIVAAAERAAAEIESEARANADSMREQAESAAAKIRADAVAQAQAHVAAVSRASATLLARVESMDGQVDALVQSLRAGASDLAGDLAAVQSNMGELYDAAAGRRSREAGAPAGEAPPQGTGSPTPAEGELSASGSPTREAAEPSGAMSPAPQPREPSAGESPASAVSEPSTARPPIPEPEPPAQLAREPSPAGSPAHVAAESWMASGAPAVTETAAAKPAPAAGAVNATGPAREPAAKSDTPGAGEAAGGRDYDARVVALNMAINGDTREATDRYLAENYEVADRQKLLDEVFAAVES